MTNLNLRARRKALNLSQAALARELGVSPHTIAVWERGEQRIEHPEMLDKAIRHLEWEMDGAYDWCPNGHQPELGTRYEAGWELECPECGAHRVLDMDGRWTWLLTPPA